MKITEFLAALMLYAAYFWPIGGEARVVQLNGMSDSTGLERNSESLYGQPVPIKHANHIFNAIHSSMRQWGSSLHHNGMSYFIAKVPAGTEFYHGTWNSEPVQGMEWLAFEPEHASLFALPRLPRRKPPGERPGDDKLTGNVDDNHGHGDIDHLGLPDHIWSQRPLSMSVASTDDIEDEYRPEDEIQGGFLHTYAAKQELRLLYLDGMSAAKSSKGTLDTQDVVLLNLTDGGLREEMRRARGLCDLAEQEWNDNIDGILRMEGGFEIILCSFAKRLDTIRITRAKPRPRRGDMHMGLDNETFFAYYQAITARYHGIGGNRVSLDYDNFVTAFEDPNLDLFREDEKLPRLQHLPDDAISSLREAVHALAFPSKAHENSRSRTSSAATSSTSSSYDWQAITDLIVARYAPRLSYIRSGAFPTANSLKDELVRMLQPFIDFEYRNKTLEIERCATHFFTSTPDPRSTLAGRAISQISFDICSALSSIANSLEGIENGINGSGLEHAVAMERVEDLMNYLSWPTWKECRGCKDDEVCVVPVWPWGAAEDWESPSCGNASSIRSRQGYWDEYD